MNGTERFLRITMPDGSRWDVPVRVIAVDRAKDISEIDGVSFDEAFRDTIELFESDPYEIHDWAANNMDWEDVVEVATKVSGAEGVDYQEGWMNGDYEVVEVPR